MTRHLESPRCASNACIDVTPIDESLFAFTSDGSSSWMMIATAAETAQFLEEVKAGKWDHILRQARA